MNKTLYNFEEAQQLVDIDEKLQSAIENVTSLDFSMLKTKLISDKGWTEEFVNEIEDLYIKFLALNIYYPNKQICPTGPIDEFWHAHILDTQAYANDCNFLFGKFLHHFPYFGMRGPEDEEALKMAFDDSIDLFIKHYGVDPTAGDIMARSCRPQRCP